MNYLYASIRRDAPLCKEVHRRTWLAGLHKWQAALVEKARAARKTEVETTFIFTVSIPKVEVSERIQAGIQDIEGWTPMNSPQDFCEHGFGRGTMCPECPKETP